MRTSEFACAEIPGGEPYHRLARGDRFRWWVPALSLVMLAILLFVLGVAVAFVVTIVAVLGGSSLLADSPRVGEIAGLAIGLGSSVLLLPIVLIVVRVVQWRRARSLLSVEGRLRGGWLARCSALALVCVAAVLGAYLLLVGPFGLSGPEAGPPPDVRVVAAAVAVIVLLVPFQAVAEEFGLRGLVMQLVGSLGASADAPGGHRAAARVLRSPAPAVLAGGTLLAALYASAFPEDGWTAATLAVMGLCAAWLTWRTGGLEAAIGLHVVNGLVQIVFSVAEGRMAAIGTGAVVGAGPPGTGTPLGLVLAVVLAGAYALGAVALARRTGVRRISPAAPA
ncbi:type II CAAX prenyl endopeptidase Rce1 family protein [Nocardiopsis sp. LOL_012]|uniref:CPBP family glutamic-type intramembrane protease n=1 Tax=Nocardiopsis sp. LOL_012 TaxID=3345409 RepID=UPI003A86899C